MLSDDLKALADRFEAFVDTGCHIAPVMTREIHVALLHAAVDAQRLETLLAQATETRPAETGPPGRVSCARPAAKDGPPGKAGPGRKRDPETQAAAARCAGLPADAFAQDRAEVIDFDAFRRKP